MKISHKFHLISLFTLMIMTVAVIVAGSLIISELVNTLQHQIMQSELEKACQAVFDTLNRSGVNAAVRETEAIHAELKDEPLQMKTGRLSIIEPPDRVVFHPDYRAGDKVKWHHLTALLRQKNGIAEYVDQGVSRYTVFSTIEPIGWLVCLSIAKDEMYAKRIEYLRNIIIIAAVIVAVSALVVSLFVNHFVRRIQTTLDCVKRIEKGEFSVCRPSPAVNDEVGRLQAGVNAMSAKIQARTQALHREIARRERTEGDLLRAKNLISNIIDSMPSALIKVDGKGRISLWNKTVAQATGISADTARGESLYALLPWMVSEKESICRSIRSRQVIENLKRPRQVENRTIYESITIYPLIDDGEEEAVVRIDDVTETAQMEEMMIQSEKMLTVGGLAAGIAHEINNPLAGMLQTASVMSNRLCANRQIPANQSAAEDAGTSMVAIERFMTARGIPAMIETIRSSGMRVADIVKNMLSFARKADTMVSVYPFETLIDKTLELAAADYSLKKQYDFKTIEIIKDYAANVPAVPCHESKIQQVLLNILGNGAQAMQRVPRRPSRFILRTRFDEKRSMACIEIEDNGPGMDEATSKRVFEPFFTTKPKGVGTGLGLSVSYFIITENHGGEITVKSREGVGTTFIICLPVGR